MQGPPITVICDCGGRQPVAYGDSWTCPACGRTWNTSQIPADEYWGTTAALRRYRRVVWGIAGIAAGVLIPVSVLVSPVFFVLLMIIVGGLYLVVLPKWRGRVLEQVSGRPSWKLHPE